jgi:hypothetical protein
MRLSVADEETTTMSTLQLTTWMGNCGEHNKQGCTSGVGTARKLQDNVGHHQQGQRTTKRGVGRRYQAGELERARWSSGRCSIERVREQLKARKGSNSTQASVRRELASRLSIWELSTGYKVSAMRESSIGAHSLKKISEDEIERDRREIFLESVRVHRIKERMLRDATRMDKKECLNYLDERNDVEIRKRIKNFRE